MVIDRLRASARRAPTVFVAVSGALKSPDSGDRGLRDPHANQSFRRLCAALPVRACAFQYLVHGRHGLLGPAALSPKKVLGCPLAGRTACRVFSAPRVGGGYGGLDDASGVIGRRDRGVNDGPHIITGPSVVHAVGPTTPRDHAGARRLAPCACGFALSDRAVDWRDEAAPMRSALYSG